MKGFFKKISGFLHEPHPVFVVSSYVVSAGVIALAVLLSVSEDLSELPVTYAAYVLAAVCLAYVIYSLVLVVPRLRRYVREKAGKYTVTRGIMGDYDYRTLAFAVMSSAVSLGMMGLNLFMSIYFRSLWYGCLAGYYLALVAVRLTVLLAGRRINARSADQEAARVKLYAACGGMLILLNAALAAAVTQFITASRPLPYSEMMIYVTAAYAVYKLTLAIINIRRSRRASNYLTRALRDVGLTDACVSLFAMQIAMVAVFGEGSEDMFVINVVVGFAVCALTMLLGVYMIVKGVRETRRARRARASEEADDEQA